MTIGRTLTRTLILLAILWSLPLRASSAQAPLHQQVAPHGAFRSVTAPRALVLEPFGTDLGLGADSGRPEIDALADAGFRVDVYRDSAVSIPVIESMAGYAVVYIESHSGTCGPPECNAQDVFVLTGTRVPDDTTPYADLFRDGSLTEGSPDTDPGEIYLAITSQLIKKHLGRFPDSSIIFINGCDVLSSPNFLQALSAHNAVTVFSWNKRVNNADAEAAADFIFARLADGDTSSAALAHAHSVGLGTSAAEDGAILELVGNPDATLANALDEATPTPTPTDTLSPTDTPAPTATPRPTPRATRATGTCKKGHKRVKGKCRKIGKR